MPASTAQFLTVLPFPAFVEGRHLDVLAANRLATALSPRLVAGGNRLRDVFLDPAEQDMWPDWEAAAAALVASFRIMLVVYHPDPSTTGADKLTLLAAAALTSSGAGGEG
ncbi:hypothetical protein [Actinoplanes sp. NPDC051494]|uniref:MmyB family transcriptional regulator n=1 Tax=Actinoplanes sp. NPDC051494 TaxID=3363907 RepID=UPI0037AF3887